MIKARLEVSDRGGEGGDSCSWLVAFILGGLEKMERRSIFGKIPEKCRARGIIFFLFDLGIPCSK
jgi:hypothetical protein